MRKLLFFILHIAVSASHAQVIDNSMLPASDYYTIDIFHDNIYRTDSIKYSNGGIVVYTYDNMGNRTSYNKLSAPPLSELKILDSSVPDTLGAGTQALYIADWENSGPLVASNFRLQAFISTDSIWDPNDMPAGITNYSGTFPSFAILPTPTNINIPLATNPGQYYWLILHIDDNMQVTEYSDTNNLYLHKVFITPCPNPPLVNSTIIPEVCNANNGVASITLPTDYSIQWFNGYNDTILKGLSGRQFYSYALQHGPTSCSYQDSLYVGEFPNLQADIIKTHTTCNQNNGSAQILPTSGTTPYYYSWSNGDTSSQITGLSPGQYTVTVSDSTGCQNVFSTQVQATNPPTLSIVKTDATCGYGNGIARALPNAGLSPYLFTWSNGDTSQSISNLVPFSIHSVTITDFAGCTATSTIQIGNVGGVEASITRTGSFVKADAVQGIAPFSYIWSTGETTQGITVTQADTFFVFITDALGCTDSASVIVSPGSLSRVIDLGGEPTKFYVYPNPNDGQRIMVYTNLSDIQTLIVYDAQGKVTSIQTIDNTSSEIVLNSILSAGTYYLSGRDEKNRQLATTKFIVR